MSIKTAGNIINDNLELQIVTRLRAGRPGFDFRQGLEFSLLAATGAHPASYRLATGSSFPGGGGMVKRPGLEADHSPPSSSKVKNAWS
jgi:hypothetical protein